MSRVTLPNTLNDGLNLFFSSSTMILGRSHGVAPSRSYLVLCVAAKTRANSFDNFERVQMGIFRVFARVRRSSRTNGAVVMDVAATDEAPLALAESLVVPDGLGSGDAADAAAAAAAEEEDAAAINIRFDLPRCGAVDGRN